MVAVGQEWEYRDEMTTDVVQSVLLPWLFALPVMVVLLLWLLQRELTPLRQIARQLQQRSPDNADALNATRLPSEVRPIVDALNGLFARIHAMLQRERRFTSDAAHELRSPLAALKVQSEVVQLAHDDAGMRQHALTNTDASINRATRLVDQLLTLSRLDAQRALAESETVDIEALLRQAIVEQDKTAQQAGITLRLENRAGEAQACQGHPLLLSLLLRNLLDNAIRYGRAGGTVTLILRRRQFEVYDDGPAWSKRRWRASANDFTDRPDRKNQAVDSVFPLCSISPPCTACVCRWRTDRRAALASPSICHKRAALAALCFKSRPECPAR